MQEHPVQTGEFVVAEYYREMLRYWDFEQLLAALRRNPVLRGDTDDTFIVALELFALA